MSTIFDEAVTVDSNVPSLDRFEARLHADQQLPGIGRAPMGMFARQDVLLEKLGQAYLYIVELAHRVRQVEAQQAR